MILLALLVRTISTGLACSAAYGAVKAASREVAGLIGDVRALRAARAVTLTPPAAPAPARDALKVTPEPVVRPEVWFDSRLEDEDDDEAHIGRGDE
ncbi:MAG TPA: hypothetical protein VGF17_21875 [Phytomonospora sp.]